VEVRTGAKVTRIDQDGVEIDGPCIAARTTFWAAGVAASPAAKWLGQAGDKSGRVVVDSNLAVPGCPGIFAIGDTAASNGWMGAGVPGLAPAAKQQGQHAAEVIRAAIKGRKTPGAFQYRHYGNLATIGRLAAVVDSRLVALGPRPCLAPCGRTQPGDRGTQLALGLPDLSPWNPPDHREHDGRLSQRSKANHVAFQCGHSSPSILKFQPSVGFPAVADLDAPLQRRADTGRHGTHRSSRTMRVCPNIQMPRGWLPGRPMNNGPLRFTSCI
jgi:pyridine nucleotide-disulfide oxidoreductase